MLQRLLYLKIERALCLLLHSQPKFHFQIFTYALTKKQLKFFTYNFGQDFFPRSIHSFSLFSEKRSIHNIQHR